MVGTLFGLPLSIQSDSSGDPESGGMLYLYQAGTSTPTTSYEDSGLTSGLELPFPIVLDAVGRVPQFWLSDGSYRARLTDAQGNELFDEDNITALGPSSGTGSGTSVSSEALLGTGDMIWLPLAGTRAGWIRCNGRTIGSVASGATERANADTEDLFGHLWTNYSNTFAPIAGGRGASAAADWAANKAIGTIDMRGRAAFGLDDMGNTDANVLDISTGGGSTGGTAALGQPKSTITLTQANLPSVSLSSTSLTISTTLSNETLQLRNTDTDTAASGSGQNVRKGGSQATITIDTTIGGTVPLGGSGTSINLTMIPPLRVGTWYMKL